ncbi:CCR4-NOT transcription complex subunit 3-like protein [Leptotrombidium deliense]|uniref:CCR4-NOT transcription complex subunit 3-like protein n=1 Tax=Leptotrombidium deliense TaxID=299467 RepID=A0A443SL30_9ACAR|nr:CCR4-NOT transcription complex subunit 3-like protein [Leptotrombidium deliense]
MADRRKLQGEIERCHKKVQEGVETFEDIWQKAHNAPNSNQKEKYETDLKKEIKKLQRLRDQIKTWLASSEIKDKRLLLEDRKLIETQMERFKVLERETKTKAYSKEGLGAAQKLDPAQKEKDEVTNWLSYSIDNLNMQVDQFECEIETLSVGLKKKKSDKEKQDKLDKLKAWVEKHRFHINQLETIMRMLDNSTVDVDQVKKIKDDVEYYIESSQEPDFEENEFLYDDLELEDMQEYLLKRATSAGNHTSSSFDSGTTKNSSNTTGDEEGSNSVQSNTPTSNSSSPAPSPGLTNHSKGALYENNLSIAISSCTTVNNSNSISSSSSGASTLVKPMPVWSHNTSVSSSISCVSSSVSSSKVMNASQPSTLTTTSTTTTPSRNNSSTSSNSSSPSVNSVNNHNTNSASSTLYAVAASTAVLNNCNNRITHSLGDNCVKSDSVISDGLLSNSSTPPTLNAGLPHSTSPPNILPLSPLISLQDSAQQQQQLLLQNNSQLQQLQLTSPAATTSSALYSVAAASSSTSSTVSSDPWNNTVATSRSQNVSHSQTNSLLINGPLIHDGLKLQNQLQQHQSTPMSSLKSMAQQAVVSAGLEVQINSQNEIQQQTPQVATIFDSGVLSTSNAHTINSIVTSSAPSVIGLLSATSKSIGPIAPPVIPASVVNLSIRTPGVTSPATTGVQQSEANIPPLLGVAPLGPIQLPKSCIYQLHMLEAASRHTVHPIDSQRLRPYLSPNVCPVPSYYPQQALPHCDTVDFFHRLSTETLFFVFYFMEGTKAQYLAAKALKKQSWRFHTKYMMWFQRHEEPKTITDEYEQGTYIYFDYEKWGQRKKEHFTFEYRYLEDRDLN